MNKLDLLKLAEFQDDDAYEDYEMVEEKNNETNEFKVSYEGFYDDVKQPNKYIKEDW